MPPEDVPAAALIPIGAEVTGHWETSTSAGDAIVVAWSVPGQDPFRQDRGIAAWRRFADGGLPWRPVWGMAFPARRDPLLGLSAQVADVTGDGSADAIAFAERGGSGGCGTTLVVDLASGTEVFREEGCDRRIDAVGRSRRAHDHRGRVRPGRSALLPQQRSHDDPRVRRRCLGARVLHHIARLSGCVGVRG